LKNMFNRNPSKKSIDIIADALSVDIMHHIINDHYDEVYELYDRIIVNYLKENLDLNDSDFRKKLIKEIMNHYISRDG